MAHTGIFATADECKQKAGGGVSDASSAEAYINQFCAEAESFINVLCRENYSDSYSGLNADVKAILKEACSNLAAIYMVQYDTSGYNNSREAENIININWARFVQCIGLLRDQKSVQWINEQ